MAECEKTLVNFLAGALNVFTPEQVKALHGQISPLGDPTAVRPSPGGLQPAEAVGGASGSMVVTTPSGSGTGAMVPGAGQRS